MFSNWHADVEAGKDAVRSPWRRLQNEAVLSPGKYAQMLATRPEILLSADWMLALAARNLHWKFQVLHNAFTIVKMRASRDTGHHKHLIQMLEAMPMMWQKIGNNEVVIHGHTQYINAQYQKLTMDDDMTDVAKTIRRSWIRTTECVAGCRAIRGKMGHIFFGFNCCFSGAFLFHNHPRPEAQCIAAILESSSCQRYQSLAKKHALTEWRKTCAGCEHAIFASMTWRRLK